MLFTIMNTPVSVGRNDRMKAESEHLFDFFPVGNEDTAQKHKC